MELFSELKQFRMIDDLGIGSSRPGTAINGLTIVEKGGAGLRSGEQMVKLYRE
jgi:hypothetical protein